MKKVLVFPGYVESERDGQRHFVNGDELVNLYELRKNGIPFEIIPYGHIEVIGESAMKHKVNHSLGCAYPQYYYKDYKVMAEYFKKYWQDLKGDISK